MRLFSRLLFALSWLMLGSVFAAAETVTQTHTPKVVVSIKPLHAWVSAVMNGVAVPELLLKNSDSVHNYQLKPSDASNLSNADLVFITDKKMEVYLRKPLHNLAIKAKIIALDSAPLVKLLPMRQASLQSKHSHKKEGVKPHAKRVKYNFHFWLDPQNAIAATNYIAAVLAKADPNHATTYKDNAASYIAKLQDLIKQTQARLKDHANIKFIVFHDAYYYYEKRFGVEAQGAITVNPEHQPGAHRIKMIRNKIKEAKVACVFTEPQFPPAIVHNIIEGTEAKQGALDPIGAALVPGPESYLDLVNHITDALIRCSAK